MKNGQHCSLANAYLFAPLERQRVPNNRDASLRGGVCLNQNQIGKPTWQNIWPQTKSNVATADILCLRIGKGNAVYLLLLKWNADIHRLQTVTRRNENSFFVKSRSNLRLGANDIQIVAHARSPRRFSHHQSECAMNDVESHGIRLLT